MRVDIVTLFPEMFTALTDYGVTGRAVKAGPGQPCVLEPPGLRQRPPIVLSMTGHLAAGREC